MSRSEWDAHRSMRLNYWDGLRAGESKAHKLSERAYDRGIAIGIAVGTVIGAFAVWFVTGWFS